MTGPTVGVDVRGLGDRAVGERLVGWLASLMAIAAFVVAVLLALSLAGLLRRSCLSIAPMKTARARMGR